MKKIKLGKSNFEVPSIAVGCMRINSMDSKAVAAFVDTAICNGTNFFDHADIYGGGECESIFSRAVKMTPLLREKLIIQSKCGIVPGKMFDFSKEHIISSVDGILKRLNTEYLDILLLHRPDALVEPEEVNAAFEQLKGSGKVRHFGVSNQNPMQISLLQKSLSVPIEVNQLQLSLAHANMISSGINVNMTNDSAINRDGSILDFCRLNDITIQAWSPFQYGFFEGVFIGNDKFPKLNEALSELANKYSVSETTIAVAWILRHPAHIIPITGTTNTKRLLDCIKAAEITLTREEWYMLYMSTGNILP